MKATNPHRKALSNESCYLCQQNDFVVRKGEVRDAPEMQIIECE